MNAHSTGTGVTYQSHHAQSWQSSDLDIARETKPWLSVNPVMHASVPQAQQGNCFDSSLRMASSLDTAAGSVTDGVFSAGAVTCPWATHCRSAAAFLSSIFACRSSAEDKSMNEPYPWMSPIFGESTSAPRSPSHSRVLTSMATPFGRTDSECSLLFDRAAPGAALPASLLGGELPWVPGSTSSAALALGPASFAAAALAKAAVSFLRIAMPLRTVRTEFHPRIAMRKRMMRIAGSNLFSSTPKTTPSSSPLCMKVLAS
mmetsp:Transcript_21444/g.36644  ORF Transcript_21444/g.36644 Transcript_21444/m.36644 type:complete len:259 (-) Transcript_21444:504-1280(-)